MAANQTNTMLVTFHAMPTQLVAGVSNAWVSGYYSTEAAALADTNLAMDYLLNINPTSGSYTPTLQITTVSVSKTSLLLVAQLRTNGVPRDTTINGYYLLRGGTNAAGPYTNIPVSAIPNATFANGGRATNTIAWTSVSNFFFKSAVTNAP